ncbi:hypothetical protein GCM10027589_07470 [Actinocorallia lasiicapitis]
MVALAAGSAHAAPGPITAPPIKYTCGWPLIGTQPITVTVSTTLPDFQTGGSYSLPITAVTEVNEASAKGMWAAKAYTIEGSGVANAKLFSPEFPNGKEVKTNISIGKKPITSPGTPADTKSNVAFPPPEPTSGFSLTATGNSEEVKVTQGGWAQINVENLKLKLTPKDEAGNPTGLGTFDADCWVQEGQHNVLGQAYINGGGTPGNPPATFDTQPPRGVDTKEYAGPTKRYELAAPLSFSCPFPAIQRRTITVDMAVDFPEEIDTNTRAKPLAIEVTTHLGADVSTAIAGVFAKYLSGIAISNNIIKTPDGELASQTLAKLEEATVPDPIDEEGNTPGFEIKGVATAPALVFQKAGDGSIVIGDPALSPVRDLVLSMDAFDADHVRLAPPIGQFRRNCNLLPGSTGKNLLTFKVKQSAQPAPGQVTNLAVTPKSTTADVTWGAPATGGTPTGYDVSWTGGSTGSKESGSPATLTGLVPDKDYTVTVVAKNAAGAGPAATKTFHTDPAPILAPGPVTIEPGEVTTTTATVKWKAPATGGAPTEYLVAKGAEDPISVPASKTEAKFENLTPGTVYNFTVVAKNASGSSVPVPAQLKTADAQTPPPTPGNLKTTGVTATSVSVSWDASADADGYTVAIGDAPATAVTGTTHTFEGLTPDTDYVVKVAAVNEAGTSAPATLPVKTAKDEQPPAPVTNLKGVPAVDQVSLSWNASPGATSYDVIKGSDAPINVTGTEKVITGLEASTEYTFKVIAKNAKGDSAPTSTTVTTLAKEVPPVTVTNLKATATTTEITLDWTGSPGATSYDVIKGSDAPVNVTGTSHKFTALTPGTEYTFKVIAKNAAGSSAPAEVTAKTLEEAKPLAAPVITVDSADSFAPTLSWGAVNGATGYEVYRDGAKVGSPTATTFKSADLAYGKSYKFTVKAVNAVPAETSPASNEITVTPKDTTKPTAPVLTPGTVSSNSAALSWTASTDSQAGVAGYDVFKDGAKVNTTLVTATNLTVTGLDADKDYKFTVQAVDKAGNVSDLSNEATVHTLPITPGADFAYGITGSSKIKAANGTVPLKGSIKGKLDAAGKFTSDLTLDKTTGNFSLFGFIPATAEVSYVQQGQTTGTLAGANLTTNSKMLVKIPTVKVFGFEVAGGPTCQTKTPIDVTLKSTDFKAATGGTLSGSYTLPAIDGCGLLTPIVSALVAGPNNTINLTLKK